MEGTVWAGVSTGWLEKSQLQLARKHSMPGRRWQHIVWVVTERGREVNRVAIFLTSSLWLWDEEP